MNKSGGVEGISNKRGQVTLFIIIAVVIIALAILIFIFYPQLKSFVGAETKSPSAFMEDCLRESFEGAVKTISTQGGMIDPKNYYLYQDDKIGYLCYVNEYYKPCVMQIPDLKGAVGEEISGMIKADADKCISSMKQNYEKAGYEVNIEGEKMAIELLPKRIVLSFGNTITLTRAEETQRYKSFNVVLNNNLYELTSIAQSILNWEASQGDADIAPYMMYYRDLKVEKLKQDDGTTIYILTNRETGDKFQFASRSYAFPAGY